MPPKEEKAADLLRIRERPQTLILKLHALKIPVFISFTVPAVTNLADGNTMLLRRV